MIDTLLLVFILSVQVLSVLARANENRKLKEQAKPIIEEHEKGWKELSTLIASMKNTGDRTYKLINDFMTEDLLPPVDATRIYAAILRNGLAMRLHMLPAETVEEFTDKSQAIVGPGWKADIIEYLDVHSMEKVIIREPKASEKKEMNSRQGLHFLELTRDKFAKPTQRKVVEDIISTYKKTYELS